MCGKDLKLYLVGRNSLKQSKGKLYLTMNFPEHQINITDKKYLSFDGQTTVTMKTKRYIFEFSNPSIKLIKNVRKNLYHIGISITGKIHGVINSKISLNGDNTDKGCNRLKSKIVLTLTNFQLKEKISSFELNTPGDH